MNVYELDGYALDLLCEEMTDANRTAFAPGFLRSYNRAYAELQRAVYRPWRWERVTLADQSFRISALAYACAGLVKVSRSQDFSGDSLCAVSPPLPFAMRDADTVALPGYGGAEAWALYHFLYPDLRNGDPLTEPAEPDETNTPQIPAAAHPALAMLAAADFCRRRRRADLAALHMAEYRRLAAGLMPREPGASARRFRHLYREGEGGALHG